MKENPLYKKSWKGLSTPFFHLIFSSFALPQLIFSFHTFLLPLIFLFHTSVFELALSTTRKFLRCKKFVVIRGPKAVFWG